MFSKQQRLPIREPLLFGERQPSTVNRVNRRQAYYSKSGNSARLYTNTSASAVVVLPSS